MTSEYSRRTFLKSTMALSAAAAALPGVNRSAFGAALAPTPRAKQPARVRGAFFYPPAQVVLDGQCEDGWSAHQWSTWPGNQFEPEEQQRKFLAELRRIIQGLDLELIMDEGPIYTDAAIQAFIGEVQASKPDALLLFNFWNSFSAKLFPILDAFDGPIILYHPLGASHQLPPERFRTAPRLQYIHSIEHYDALEAGLRAVHAKTRMARSKVLRVSGRLEQEADDTEPFFGLPVHGVPAAHFNDLFDATALTDDMRRLARRVRKGARNVTDLSDEAFADAVRAHGAVLELMKRHDADAITIECLFLKHRKPCLSFSLNNGALVPCGCENDLNATLSLMLGANLFGVGGFQHNPEFDTVENLYFGAHCTCATQLHGPGKEEAPYILRPFFHQLPKTLALDVQWPAGDPVTLFKYQSDGPLLHAWAGEIVSSPACPPAGGCATRVLVRLRDVDNVCDVYPGPHPALFHGDHARRAKTFAKLYGLDLRTNG
ncbi:MAG TPA: twin-arginine translocation signal domain-containing protein [Candidatus Hydrogenedentes bacterium]|nr:twin-arginine translocation signal domain-containing protein [Candidatus Hydrogenedentota bacterium]